MASKGSSSASPIASAMGHRLRARARYPGGQLLYRGLEPSSSPGVCEGICTRRRITVKMINTIALMIFILLRCSSFLEFYGLYSLKTPALASQLLIIRSVVFNRFFAQRHHSYSFSKPNIMSQELLRLKSMHVRRPESPYSSFVWYIISKPREKNNERESQVLELDGQDAQAVLMPSLNDSDLHDTKVF